MIDEVKQIFKSGKMPEHLNITLIALIPKIQGPETLCNYRPISLCNTVYKMVTKIIVARLRPFLDKFISPLQAAFVPGRKGINNVINCSGDNSFPWEKEREDGVHVFEDRFGKGL